MEQEIKYWGIWVVGIDKWLTDDSGMIFAVASEIVADLQRQIIISKYHTPMDLIVKEIK